MTQDKITLDHLGVSLQRELEGKPLGYISDIYLQQGKPPVFFSCGEFRFPEENFFEEYIDRILTKEDMGSLINECWRRNEEKLPTEDRPRSDFAFTLKMTVEGYDPIYWRVRAHTSTNYAGRAICLRLLTTVIPDLDELDMPRILRDVITKNPTGLVLVSGGTGSGKSTTVAALIKAFAESGRRGHIATLEDPVEYVLDFPNLLVTQQWVGVHVPTWSEGIRGALRDKVELLMIGELRDQESVRAALQAATSGHIVVATAHFTESVSVLTYIEDLFPPSERSYIRNILVESLLAVCCQKLITCEDYGMRRPVPCYELFVNDPTLANNLKKDQLSILPSLMENSEHCIQWNDRLEVLYRNRMISQQVYKLNLRNKE